MLSFHEEDKEEKRDPHFIRVWLCVYVSCWKLEEGGCWGGCVFLFLRQCTFLKTGSPDSTRSEAKLLDVFGTKAFRVSSLLFIVTSTKRFYLNPPPPPKQNWVETGKHCIQKPLIWELSRLWPETATKLFVHEFSFDFFLCQTLSYMQYTVNTQRNNVQEMRTCIHSAVDNAFWIHTVQTV